ncbi:MAG: site-specific integrase [Solirubrobacteraceae bacterium]
MARRPPSKIAARRGPTPTNRLPERSDASRTWTGPPYERSPRRWSGNVDFAGHKHSVGTFDTPRAWGYSRDELLIALRDAARQGQAPRVRTSPLDGVTVREFVGEGGEKWPWNYRRGRRRAASTFAHHDQMIRALVARFGDSPLHHVPVEEAAAWAASATENQLTSALAMFNDAARLDRTLSNPLAGLSRSRTRGRADMPEVLTADEVDHLKQLARATDPFHGTVLEAAIEIAATSGCRPGELWAMDPQHLDLSGGEIFIGSQVSKQGRLVAPKYDGQRWIALSPMGCRLLTALPRDHEVLLPTKTGRRMTQSNWTTYWHPLREAFTATLPADHWLRQRIADQGRLRAAEPDPLLRRRIDDGKLDFYELRHRAATFMATPAPDGLGLSAPDIAHQMGHQDGGALVERVYIHRNSELTRARLRRAMGHRD